MLNNGLIWEGKEMNVPIWCWEVCNSEHCALCLSSFTCFLLLYCFNVYITVTRVEPHLHAIHCYTTFTITISYRKYSYSLWYFLLHSWVIKPETCVYKNIDITKKPKSSGLTDMTKAVSFRKCHNYESWHNVGSCFSFVPIVILKT